MVIVRVPWTTVAELHYLDKIGSFSPLVASTSRRELLLGYLAGAQRRVDWGEIDQALVVKHAYRLLTQAALEG